MDITPDKDNWPTERIGSFLDLPTTGCQTLFNWEQNTREILITPHHLGHFIKSTDLQAHIADIQKEIAKKGCVRVQN